MSTISKAATRFTINAFTITAILLLSSTSAMAKPDSVQQKLQQQLQRNIEQRAQQKFDLQMERALQQLAQQHEQQLNTWLAKAASKQTNFERTIKSRPVDTVKIKLAAK